MKNIFSLLILLSVSFSGIAQSKMPAPDKSPLDVSYYPNRYPVLKIQDKATEPMLARVFYSRPQKNDRSVFGGLIEYGKVWRLGANEATEIEFFQNVKINNVKVKKGRYTLYSIPNENSWTMIVNKENDTWGSFKYDEKKDVVRVEVPVEKITETVDSFTMYCDKIDNGFSVITAWENVKVSLPVYLQ